MKLHQSKNSQRNAFTGYGPGFVAVNGVRYESSLVVMPGKISDDWQVPSVDLLRQENIEALAALAPEVVLLGTGSGLRFPKAGLLAKLTLAGIGAEVMDTQAACRTYNILAEEGRNVAAALILG